MLKGKKIVLGVTGSIAAYKAPLLARLLVKAGADVKVAMTRSAKDFVTPLTLSVVTTHPVMIEPFDEKDGTWNCHVDLGNWADLMIMAPLSANTMAKMAHGVADNFLMTVYLSAQCPVFIAPAMDLDMYKHPTTQKNVEILKGFGHRLIEPQSGELASGLIGRGRMEEPDVIYQLVCDHFAKQQDLAGKTALVTAGPTYEAIDPVRFIGNCSSGKMGYALAEELAARGAKVCLVSGPTHETTTHSNIDVVAVRSAAQMQEACETAFPTSDIVVMSAAVADYTPATVAGQKMKKSEASISLELKKTVDILAQLGSRKQNHQCLVGFALETENELANAKQKLDTKNLDFIVLNSLQDAGAGFGTDTNKVSLVDREKVIACELKSKAGVATDIVDKIIEIIRNK